MFRVTVGLWAAMAFAGFWVYFGKAYYPDLPYDGGSKKEAIQKLENSGGELIELASDGSFYWLGHKGNRLDGRNRVIDHMESRGYTYDYDEGSGLFFQKNGRTIVTGTNWTAKYVLYKVPVEARLDERPPEV